MAIAKPAGDGRHSRLDCVGPLDSAWSEYAAGGSRPIAIAFDMYSMISAVFYFRAAKVTHVKIISDLVFSYRRGTGCMQPNALRRCMLEDAHQYGKTLFQSDIDISKCVTYSKTFKLLSYL